MEEAFLGNCIVHWYEQKTGSLFLWMAELPSEKSNFLPYKNPLVKVYHQSAHLPTCPSLHVSVSTGDGVHWHPTHIPCAFWCLPVCPCKEGWSDSPSEWRQPWGTAAPSVCLCFQEIFKVWVLYIRAAANRVSCSSLDALITIAYKRYLSWIYGLFSLITITGKPGSNWLLRYDVGEPRNHFCNLSSDEAVFSMWNEIKSLVHIAGLSIFASPGFC